MSRSSKNEENKGFARKVNVSRTKVNSIKEKLNERMKKIDREYTNRERQARVDASKVVLNS